MREARFPPSDPIRNTDPPGNSVQGLDHDVFVLRKEVPGRSQRARDHCRRHVLGEIEHPHLFRRVPDRLRVVDDQSVVLDPLEQVRGRDVAEVERRILPHQDDIDVLAEVEDRKFAQPEMVARDGLDRDLMGPRVQPSVLPGQILGEIMVELMPARLGAKHDREGGIAGDVDLLQRVHLHCNAKAHCARVGEGQAFVTLARRWADGEEVGPER